MDEQHPFKKLASRYVARRDAEEDLRFEHAKVDLVLKTLGLARLRAAALREAGGPWLTFEAFRAVVPSFPLRLHADRLRGVDLQSDPRATLHALLTALPRAPFAKAYLDLYDEVVGRGRFRGALALVVPRRKFRDGLVVHETDLSEWTAGGVLSYTWGPDGLQRTLSVQPFGALLKGMAAAGWRPT